MDFFYKLLDSIRYNMVKVVVPLVILVLFVPLTYYFLKNYQGNIEGEMLTLENVVGEVKYSRGDEEKIIENGSEVFCGGTFYVGEGSSATVIFDDGKSVDLLANCIMEVTAKNSIANGESGGNIKSIANATVKSYSVMISKGEAIIDIRNISDKGFFRVSTPHVNFYTGAAKLNVNLKEETNATYVTVERGEVEIKDASLTLSEGDSMYATKEDKGRCHTVTLEKKASSYLIRFIETGTEEDYEVFSGKKADKSKASYNGEVCPIEDLEMAQKVYDIFDEIYVRAESGETSIEVETLNGESITVHIQQFENNIITFDPIDFRAIYPVTYRL